MTIELVVMMMMMMMLLLRFHVAYRGRDVHRNLHVGGLLAKIKDHKIRGVLKVERI